ncbi:RNA methyltransferase [bacterium]|nr:RNA methyltransferase [bacterium]
MRSVFVILSRPSSPENIGLVARGMKNTGFNELRLILDTPIDPNSYITAVHAEEILDNSGVYPDISTAVTDMDVVFAAVARHRKNYTSLSLKQAVRKMLKFPPESRIGILFGNERTGLTSEELCKSNFLFAIPQATSQPSYNLASAVLITLFSIYNTAVANKMQTVLKKPLPRREQEECIRLILQKLEEKKFINPGNKAHVTSMVHDLFGRMAITAKDRDLLLAIFSKGPDRNGSSQ